MKVEGELRSNMCCLGSIPQKKNTHNVTILLTEDILNQFGRSFIYPMIRTAFFKNIPRGADSINNTTLLQYVVEFVDENLRNSTYFQNSWCFLFSCFFLGQFSSLNISRISYDFVRRHARPSHSPRLLPGCKVHWNFVGFWVEKLPDV